MDYARPMRYPGASKCKRTSTKDPQMLILSLTYLKANEEADRYMEPHMAWVKEAMSAAGSSPPAARSRAPAA